jgi:hypothetical protein
MDFAQAPTAFLRWWSPKPRTSATPEAQQKAAALVHTGRGHRAAARILGDQRMWIPAAALYERALGCFLEVNGTSASLSPREWITGSAFGGTDQGRDAVRLLEGHGLSGRRVERRSRRALEGLDRIVSTLGNSLYPASERDALWLRVRRRFALGIAASVALVATGFWLAAPRNLARGKHVTASSVRLGSPQALVNGAIEWGTFGLHTGSGREWAIIDLGDFYTLSSVEVFGRGDGRFEFDLPLHVDLSADGVAFRPAGACTDIFTQATPCVVNLPHSRARYVRVSGPEIVLSEVEVFGTR